MLNEQNDDDKSKEDVVVDYATLEKTNLIMPSMSSEEMVDVLEHMLFFLENIASNLDLTGINLDFFDLTTHLNSYSETLQENLNKQIDLILHHPKFSNLEGKWKGLEHIINNTELDSSLKIKVLNISKSELIKDLFRNDWDQSLLFNLIYEGGMGIYGGEPFSCVIYDEYFTSGNQDIELMSKLSSVCAAAHAPCISSIHPIMLNSENLNKINQTRDINKVLANKLAWQAFRKSEDSRYFALALPRVMARAPYSVDNNPADDINYTEIVDGENTEHFTWMNAAYVLGVRILTAQTKYNWTAAIRGVDGGGLALDLPVYIYTNSNGEFIIKCSTEVAITDRKEKELSDLGFIVLCPCKGTNYAAFFSTQTCQKPEVYTNNNATANARLSTGLQYMLIVSRFAHYVKVMLRNKIGSFQTKIEIQSYLQNWLSDYVLINESAPQELKAQMPLREAKVEVTEIPGTIGVYNAILWLSPHLQLDEINVSIRLVAKIPTLSN
jgi:type VI secretion system protein ImpC